MLTKQFTVLSSCDYNHTAPTVKITTGASSQLYWIGDRSDNYIAVWIGSGDTAATLNDYNLESPLSLTLNSKSYQVGAEMNGADMYMAIATYTNNTGSAVTVKEVGLVMRSQFNGEKFALWGRKVLATPVTIGAGETYTFTYKISVQTS